VCQLTWHSAKKVLEQLMTKGIFGEKRRKEIVRDSHQRNPLGLKSARQVIAVPKSELGKREAAYQRKKTAEKKRKAAYPVTAAPGQPDRWVSTLSQCSVAMESYGTRTN